MRIFDRCSAYKVAGSRVRCGRVAVESLETYVG
jgi:hypothetical protein